MASSIDLNGEILFVPENCVLKFNGRGSFNNEVVKGKKTIVEDFQKRNSLMFSLLVRLLESIPTIQSFCKRCLTCFF